MICNRKDLHNNYLTTLIGVYTSCNTVNRMEGMSLHLYYQVEVYFSSVSLTTNVYFNENQSIYRG